MSVLVTGGAGFVGLNLIEALIDAGEEVVLLDAAALPPEAARTLEASTRPPRVVCGDLLDAQTLERAFEQRPITHVVHCAAVTSGAEREARDPARIAEVNVQGTIGVLEAARRHGVRRVVYVGSGAMYGESLLRAREIDEDTPALPHTLYGITKFAAERVCGRLRELWPLDVACVRLGTVIGAWERDTGVRDSFGTHTQLAGFAVRGVTAILPAHEVRRDWVHAKDVAAGIRGLLEAPALGHLAYNLSSGVEWPDAIASWCEALRRAFPGFDYRVAEPGEAPNVWYTASGDRGIMRIDRLARDAGYTPRYPRDAAYADLAHWVARHRDFYRHPAPARPARPNA